MHALEIITRLNGETQRAPHPLHLHPRIYALRRLIRGMGVCSEYVARLYSALYKYADQIVERPYYIAEEGWDDFETLQQVTLSDWMETSVCRLAGRGIGNEGA
jgi:hypothetical protein